MNVDAAGAVHSVERPHVKRDAQERRDADEEQRERGEKRQGQGKSLSAWTSPSSRMNSRKWRSPSMN